MTQQLGLVLSARCRATILIRQSRRGIVVAIADPMHESGELAKSIGVARYADWQRYVNHVGGNCVRRRTACIAWREPPA